MKPMNEVRGIATDKGFIDIPKGVNAIDFIVKSDGNRPAVNDPRKNTRIRTELSKAELKAQEKATRAWERKLNG